MLLEYLCNSVERLASLWRTGEQDVMTLAIPDDCKEFRDYYDDIQDKISKLSVVDGLLAGKSIRYCGINVISNFRGVVVPYRNAE